MRKHVLIFCYRFYDFRLWLMTGLLESLAQKHDVSILCPADMAKTLTSHSSASIKVLSYDDKDVRHSSKILEKIHGFCVHVFATTYASRAGHVNRSAAFHRGAFLKKGREKGLKIYVPRLVIVGLSQIASIFPPLRWMIAAIYKVTKPQNPFADLIARTMPDIAILATFGQEQDGIFLLEAERAGLQTLVAIQSWDKTSSKGYPFLWPDDMIVWNEPSRQEALHFLNFKPERVWAEGSPVWDNFFAKSYVFSRDEFMKKMGLRDGMKTIFVALNSWSYHEGNKNMITLLAESLQNNRFAEPVQILIRYHPSYGTDAGKNADLEAFVANFQSIPNLYFTKPETMDEGKSFLYNEDDSRMQASSFAHCDVTISSVSTFMIESAIFDRPAINVEYGRWVNEIYDFDISEYTAEHIVRIYDYGATYRAFNPHELIEMINQALANPGERATERAQLVVQEAGIHKGASRQAYLNRIDALLK